MNKKLPSSKFNMSAAGQRRQREMLVELKREVVARGRLRRQQRWAGAAVCVLALLAIPLVLLNWPADHSPLAGEENANTAAVSHHPDPFRLENVLVNNRPGILEKYVIPRNRRADSTIEIKTISDQQMLELMAEAGRPAVLGKIDGQTVVIALARQSQTAPN